ncbi:MAG: DHH family phosphoesterase [Candidatus Bilamarchaeaceae archaeon]
MAGYSLGDTVDFEGVVTATRFFKGSYEYTIQTKEEKVIFYSSDNISKGAEIRVSGVISSLFPISLSQTKVYETKGVYENVQAAIEGKWKPGNFILHNKITEYLKDNFFAVAQRLYSAKELNRFILLRFHHDADGIAGALALNDFLSFKAIQQNSAVYGQRDVVSDLSFFCHELHPLVILLDFGSNDKSSKQIELLRAAGAEVILIDHHPHDKECIKVPHLFLSPWLAEVENPSSYTAGYIASEIASLLGISSEKYARIACAGDKSNVINISEEDKNAALVLDYLASHSTYGNNLQFYKNVLNKKELFSSIFQQARESIEDAAGRAASRMKKLNKNDVIVFIVPLNDIVKKGEFPTSSKIVSAILEKTSEDEPVVVIGYRDGVILLRANKNAASRGINFSEIIDRLTKRFSDFIHSGGGHSSAAAIHLQKGYEQTIIESLIEEFH